MVTYMTKTPRINSFDNNLLSRKGLQCIADLGNGYRRRDKKRVSLTGSRD